MIRILCLLGVWWGAMTAAAVSVQSTSSHNRQEVAEVSYVGLRQGMPHVRAFDALQDKQGYIWFALRDGLARYDGTRAKLFKSTPGDGSPLPDNRIDRIMEDEQGHLLCKVSDCYFRFNTITERFEVLDKQPVKVPPRYEPSAEILQRISRLPEFQQHELDIICEDRQKGYWVNCNRGIYRVVFIPEPLAPQRIGIATEEIVRGLFLDSRQRIWMGDKSGDLTLFDKNGKLLCYLNEKGEKTSGKCTFGRMVSAFAETADGAIWIGTREKGLFRLYHDRLEQIQSFGDNDVYQIVRDGKGALIIASLSGGVWKIEHPMSEQPQAVCIAPIKRVRCVHVVKGHILLVGSDQGLYTLDLNHPEKTYFTKRGNNPGNGLRSNVIMGIAEDGAGRLYLATYGGGLSCIQTDQLLKNQLPVKTYTTVDGLGSDICVGLSSDSEGNLYIMGEDAISKYYYADRRFKVKRKGLFAKGITFSESHPLPLGKNRLLIGTNYGHIFLNLDSLPESSYVPPICFSCPDTLTLTPSDPHLTVECVALDYNKQAPICYAYRLEGVEADWHLTYHPVINYANIPPGTYRLHVRSTNGAGEWVDNGRVVLIHRKAKLTETTWFWLLIGALTFMLLLLAVKVFRYVMALQRELKVQASESSERIEYLNAKIHDLLSRKPAPIEPVPPLEKPVTTDSEDHRFRQQLLEFIEKNYSDSELDVTRFCKAFIMSHTKFYNLVKQSFGVSPNNLLQDFRIRRAARMLEGGKVSVSEAAYSCGFSDPKYFARVFKKMMGCPPSEYPKKAVLEDNPPIS